MATKDYKNYEEIYDDRRLDYLSKTRKAAKLFNSLKGENVEKEAFELALRRDHELQKRQLETMFLIRRSVRSETGDLRNFRNRQDKVKFLYDADFRSFLLRYLQVDVLNDDLISLPSFSAPWKAGKFYGLEVFSLMIQRYINENTEKFMEYVNDGLFLDCFHVYQKLGDNDAILRCALTEILSDIAEQADIGLEHFFKKGAFDLMVQQLHQDTAPQAMDEWFKMHSKDGCLTDWEEDMIRFRPDGCILFPRREDLKKQAHRSTRELARRWGYTQRQGVMKVMLKLPSDNNIGEECRRILLSRTDVMKDMLWWLHAISLNKGSHNTSRMALSAMNTIAESEWAAEKLITEYNLLKYVEVLITTPNLDILSGTARLVYNLCKGNFGRRKIAESKIVLRALVNMLHTFVDRLQNWSMESIKRLIEIPEMVYEIEKQGFGLRELIMMVDFYPSRTSCCDVKKLKDKLKKSKHWHRQLYALQGAKYNYDINRTLLHIQRAENVMQKGKYVEALELLRQAVVSCPPSEMTPRSNLIEWGSWDSHDCKAMKDFFPYDDFSLVPGKIRMLKTKCYLKMKEWKKALSAAEEAMFKLFEAQDGMDKGQTSAPLFNEVITMRYEIFTALNHPYQAMRDAAYLTVLDQERPRREAYDPAKKREINQANWMNLQRAQVEFECKYGYNLLPMCTMCFMGNGQPVMQCYNCGTMFCSEICQSKAWENGHKEFCQTRWDKLVKSKHRNIIPACRDGTSENITWDKPDTDWSQS